MIQALHSIMDVLAPLCLIVAAVVSVWILLDVIFGDWGQR